jgi:hypothetical protein
MAQFKFTSAGAASAGAWNNLTVADLTTDDGSYTTFNVTESAQDGFNLNVEIAADTGQTNNVFAINTAGIVAFNTGLTKSDFSDGDSRTATIQLMIEYYDMSPTNDIITDSTYKASICPFMIAGAPPFSSGTKGFFGGSGFFAGGNAALRTATRILRNTANSSNSTALYTASSDTLLATMNELTIVQGYLSSAQNAYLFRYDSLGFWDNSGTDQALFTLNDSVYESYNSPLGSDNLHIGVGFHVNSGTDASTIKTWDINIKWRKLLT